MHGNVFNEISILLAISALVAALMRFMRQPLIIGHIITGIIVGPALLGVIHTEAAFSGLSSLGIALLFFIIGLDLNVKDIRKLSKVIFMTTFAQVVLITGIGYVISQLLHFGKTESVIMGLGLALSSTIIIAKLLNDKRETMRLYAQIAIGVLILQDVVATIGKFAMAAKGQPQTTALLLLIAKGLAVTLLLYVVSKFVIPRFRRSVEGSKEFLLIFSLGWALGIATLFEIVGFSIEIGALFAGISLAALPFSKEMASRLKPLRDLFIVIFFITLGQTITPGAVSNVIGQALLMSAVVLVLKPIAVMSVMGFFGYTKRASFKSGILLSQVGEFSLIFIMAASHAHLASDEAVITMILVAIITFMISTYLIKYDDKLYAMFEHHLRFFERKVTQLEQRQVSSTHSIVLFGYGHGGSSFMKTFNAMKRRSVVVDYDPDMIDILEQKNINYIYGDASDPELLDEIQLEKSKLIISSITDQKTNLFLLEWLGSHNPSAVFVCTAENAELAAELYGHGASYVMIPHYVGTEKLTAFLKKNGFSKTEFKRYREKHLTYLHTQFEYLSPEETQA